MRPDMSAATAGSLKLNSEEKGEHRKTNKVNFM